MMKVVGCGVLCSLLLVPAAKGQTSLGALRIGGGQASANAVAYAYGYGQYAGNAPGVVSGDNVSTGAQASAGGADEAIVASALITGPAYTTVYAPETAMGVGHQTSATAGEGQLAYTGYGYGWGVAWDNYLIDDGAATGPCINGFIDIIVSTSTQGPAAAVAAVGSTVGGLNVAGGNGGYVINWNGNPVEAIATVGGNINVIVQLVDCAYQQPVPLYAYGNSAYTYAYANNSSSSALTSISVTAWFEAEDFGTNPPDAPRVILQHRDEEGHPDGDPIEVDLDGGY